MFIESRILVLCYFKPDQIASVICRWNSYPNEIPAPAQHVASPPVFRTRFHLVLKKDCLPTSNKQKSLPYNEKGRLKSALFNYITYNGLTV